MSKELIDMMKKAWEIIQEIKKEGIEVSMKWDSWTGADYLTKADLAVDAYIIGYLKEHYPEDQILTEETAEKEQEFNRNKTIWIVDPIDGTMNFSNGDDKYGILLGRYKNGEPELWISYFPEKNILLFAQKGKWVYLNNNKLERKIKAEPVFQISRPQDIGVNFENNIYENKAGTKISGIKSYHTVGRSIVQIIVWNLSACWWFRPWGKRDFCAWQVALNELGLTTTDGNGKPLNYSVADNNHIRANGCVVWEPASHKKLVDFLGNK